MGVALKKFVAALFTVAISAIGASAADLPARTYTKAPVVVAPIYNWTGFYVGVNAGGASGRIRDTLSIDDTGGVFNSPPGPGGAVCGLFQFKKNQFFCV